MAHTLLDFNQPFDVPALDATVRAFYAATNPAEVRFECFSNPSSCMNADNNFVS